MEKSDSKPKGEPEAKNPEPGGSSYNPSMPDDLEEDLEKIKGDAIGNTLYSERFVLSTLLKVVNCKGNLTEEENFEKDLCTLWDMTVEHDVVKFLLDHQSLEIFTSLISITDDKRLSEILVGIVANMCDFPPTRKELSENAEIAMTIINLISCSDTLTLVQLMRFFSAVLISDTQIDALIWFGYLQNLPDFVKHFSFILSNSINRQLLHSAIETMTAFCLKFSLVEFQYDSSTIFRDLFVHDYLVSGLVEAFKTLSPSGSTKDYDETTTVSARLKKLHANFIDINVMLLQYDKHSTEAFENATTEFLKCLSHTLIPFCEISSLFAVSHHEVETLDNINEIFELLSFPFDAECFKYLLKIWNVFESRKCSEDESEWNSDEDLIEMTKETASTLHELIIQMAKNANEEVLRGVLKSADKLLVKNFNDSCATEDMKSEEDVHDTLQKLTKISKEILSKESSS